MSHYTQLRTVIREQSMLVEALHRLGFSEVESHTRPVHLRGYLGDVRRQTAEVVVRRQYVGSSSNDLGFQRQDDGSFAALISEYDRHRYDDAWLGQLHQHYAHQQVLHTALVQGYIIEHECVLETGEIEVVVSERC